jgi:hypothetical protein
MITGMGSKCCCYKDTWAVTGKLYKNATLLSDIGELLAKMYVHIV